MPVSMCGAPGCGVGKVVLVPIKGYPGAYQFECLTCGWCGTPDGNPIFLKSGQTVEELAVELGLSEPLGEPAAVPVVAVSGNMPPRSQVRHW